MRAICDHPVRLETLLDALVVPAIVVADDDAVLYLNAAGEAWLFESGVRLPDAGTGPHLPESLRPRDAIARELEVGGCRLTLLQRPGMALPVDPVSGLPSATVAYATLAKTMRSALALGNRLSLTLLNCDFVRRIGASRGREDAFALERALGERIRSLARKGDYPCRLGPGAYAVLSIACDQVEEAWSAATRWVEALGAPLQIRGREVACSVSAGVAVAPEHGSEPGELLDHAASAAHRAQAQGRGGVCVFAPSVAQALAEELDLESSLSRAIEHAELSVVYQPKVVVVGGLVEAVGAEALLRWVHPQFGAVSPARFIPLAESAGLMPRLGRWIMDHACAQIARWRDDGLEPLPIAINVSSQQLLDPDFRLQVEDCLRRHRLDCRDIGLEITESALLQDVDESVRLLAALRDMGLSIAVDDFGTGYSSLAYLRRFPLDQLKIDRTFVLGIEDDVQASGVLRAIVAMARTLSMEVVVEGVETDAQLRRLAALGCSQFQGYLFARPENAAAFAARWLRPARVDRAAGQPRERS